MRKSIFLRRIVLLLAAALVLSGVLSAVIYLVVMQKIYVQMQADELLPIARNVAEYYQDGAGPENPQQQSRPPMMNHGNRGFLGARLHILDQNGDPVEVEKESDPPPPNFDDKEPPNAPKDLYPKDMIPPDDYELVQSAFRQIQETGKEVTQSNARYRGEGYLVVGAPVLEADGGGVAGAVVFTKKLSELNDSLGGLQVTLVLSSLITFGVMLIPGILAARKLAVPVLQMRDVSQRMSTGDFSVRADEEQKGELGDLARSINRFAEASLRLEKTRQDYISNVSHELRTPIAAIRAMSETLSDGMVRDDEKKQQYYDHILRESMRLSRLVDDLLELSRLQSGGVALKKSAFDLGEILHHCGEIYGEMASDTGIRLVLDGELEKLPVVYSNGDRIEQVLVVLLDNAIKHTPEDGTVTIRVENRRDHVWIGVQDTGAGIAEQDLPHVFDRFYQVDQSHSSEGTGLGLSIAKEILDLLDERITVESSPGEGSCFGFSVRTLDPQGNE